VSALFDDAPGPKGTHRQQARGYGLTTPFADFVKAMLLLRRELFPGRTTQDELLNDPHDGVDFSAIVRWRFGVYRSMPCRFPNEVLMRVRKMDKAAREQWRQEHGWDIDEFD
jgi:hypothetical protein